MHSAYRFALPALALGIALITLPAAPADDKDEGWVQLFNGKDLAGWKGLVADPPTRAKMTPEELAVA